MTDFQRADGRDLDQLRSVRITRNFTTNPAGSVLVEFGNTRVLHLPMQSIVRIEDVEKKGQSAIRDAATGEKVVTPFPLPGKPR